VIEPTSRFDPGNPGAALTAIAPVGPYRICGICGRVVGRRPSKGGTREHLAGQTAWSPAFRNRDELIVTAHQSCNEDRGAQLNARFHGMMQWVTKSLHPIVRRALPKGHGGHDDFPRRHVKRGQGAWR
jgi:hypothetical protein